MATKPSKIMAALFQKCPKCHEGSLYKSTNPYKLSELTKMNKQCPVCQENFLREPGFYFGAAYVSYAMTVALWIAVLVALYAFDTWGLIEFSFFENPMKFFVTGLITLVVALPLLYRLSRSMWIHFFVKYDPRAGKNTPEKA